MFFSIIIPIYNVAAYLQQCIDSVLMQSYSNMELILVDDGSTDGSGGICDAYAAKDHRVKVIHKENGGVADARNRGMDAAGGKYLLFMDGDDYWSCDILTELAKIIVAHGEPDLIFSNKESRVIPKGKKIEYSCGFCAEEFNSVSGEATLEYLFTRTAMSPYSVWRNAYKTTVIKANKLRFEKGVTLGEDADWLFRFILHTQKNILFETPFYMYRINRSGSAMATHSYQSLCSYLGIVTKWLNLSHTMNSTNLTQAIQANLTNNYVSYFKYVYFFEKEFREKLITEIKESKVLDYVTSPFATEVRSKIRKKGYQAILKHLNSKYQRKQQLKRIVLKLQLLDR